MWQILRKLGMTAQEFADTFGYSVAQVEKWKRCGIVTLSEQRSIARRLGWKIEQVQDYLR